MSQAASDRFEDAMGGLLCALKKSVVTLHSRYQMERAMYFAIFLRLSACPFQHISYSGRHGARLLEQIHTL